MQALFLTYYHRLQLWNLIGSHGVAGLKEAAVLLRIMEKVRLTDEEASRSRFEQREDRVSWNLPEPGYGDKLVELENEEARALIKVIETAQNIRVNDAAWLIPMVERLDGRNENSSPVPGVTGTPRTTWQT